MTKFDQRTQEFVDTLKLLATELSQKKAQEDLAKQIKEALEELPFKLDSFKFSLGLSEPLKVKIDINYQADKDTTVKAKVTE